jgi:hypothetical protein
VGLNDPRVADLWQLFVAGWDIWVPEGKDGGVELFWEGEGENDKGAEITILQSLRFQKGEVTLEAQLGDLTDSLTTDGERFYRFKNKS